MKHEYAKVRLSSFCFRITWFISEYEIPQLFFTPCRVGKLSFVARLLLSSYSVMYRHMNYEAHGWGGKFNVMPTAEGGNNALNTWRGNARFLCKSFFSAVRNIKNVCQSIDLTTEQLNFSLYIIYIQPKSGFSYPELDMPHHKHDVTDVMLVYSSLTHRGTSQPPALPAETLPNWLTCSAV